MLRLFLLLLRWMFVLQLSQKQRQAVRMKTIVAILMAKVPIETQPFCIRNPDRGQQRFSRQELVELCNDFRGYGNHRMLSRFCLSYTIGMLSRLQKRDARTLQIELVQTTRLGYELSGSR